jgi:predicted  nucleic acid-binding Zn-ribbon protein
MTTSFQEVVEQLRALHDLDVSIQRLEREIRQGPAKLAGFEGQIRAIEKKKKLVDDRLVILRAQIRLRENELKATDLKIERVKTQASEVKTNKEFVAYRAELSNFQGDADRISGEVLKILDVVEQAEKKIAELSADQARIKEKIDAAQKALDDSLEGVKAQRDELLTQRPERREGIPKEPLAIYERIHGSRGNALALLDGEYCSACMERLTRNDAFAVQNRNRLVQCRGCNRILIADA